MFRPKGKDPEFIWLSRFNDYSLGNDLVLLLGGMYRPEPYFIHKNVVRNKQHETICGFVLQNYREPRALANENMRVLVETLSERLPSKKHKYSPCVFYSKL
jgi:hypothetical protein